MNLSPGTKVRIIRYGKLVYFSKDEKPPANKTPHNSDDLGATYDIFPELVGRTGYATGEMFKNHLNERIYKVDVPGHRLNQFYHDQLELVEHNSD